MRRGGSSDHPPSQLVHHPPRRQRIHGPRTCRAMPSRHPKWTYETRVTTSEIRGRRGDLVVTASGNEYELGDVDPAYEAAFPGAKERLLASLKEMVKA